MLVTHMQVGRTSSIRSLWVGALQYGHMHNLGTPQVYAHVSIAMCHSLPLS